MAAESEIQVLIVGGGIGGLSLAGFLDKAGVTPVVVESAPTITEPDGVVELWPDMVPLLRQLGIKGDILESGAGVTLWSLRQPDGSVRMRLEADDTPGFIAVRYARLRQAIAATLPDRTLQMDRRFESFESETKSVTVEFENGVHEKFDVVIGADGVRSQTRAGLGGGDPDIYETTSWMFPLDPALDIVGASEIWAADGTVFRAVPTDDRAFGWLTAPTDTPTQTDGDPERLETLASEISWVLPEALTTLSTDNIWRSSDARVATDCWANGRVALLGDAAHAIHPLAGVGPLCAMEDAAVLASELIKRTDTLQSRLQRYASRRQSGRNRLLDIVEPASPLTRVDSRLADQYPLIPAVRGSRLSQGFEGEVTDPTVASFITT